MYSTFLTSMSSFKGTLSSFFPWDLPVVKIYPEWVTGPEQGKSSGRIAEEIMADHWKDFWICEIETGQQVAQLHDRYMMMMMIMTK